MKIYTRIVWDAFGRIVEEEGYDYSGPIALAKGTVDFPDPSPEEIAIQQAQLSAIKRSAALDEAIEPFLLQSMRLTRENGAIRRLTEEEYRATLSPTDLTAYDNLQLAQERETKALKGELPLTEAGQQQKQREFLSFKEAQARLGNVISGDTPEEAAATSTSGIQALKAFQERWGLFEEAERRGELTQGTASLLARYGVTSDIGVRERAGLLEFPAAPARLAQSFGGALQPYQQQRSGQFQSAQTSQSSTAGLLDLFGTVGGIALGVGLPAGFLSSVKYKKDVKATTAKEKREALEMVKDLDTHTYRYKWEGSQTPKRMGLLAETAPKEIVTPDREGLDVGRTVGLLAVATKALAEKVNARRLK